MRDTRDTRDTRRTGVAAIGKIVRSESHVRYTCQVYGPGETAAPPNHSDYAFGSFVRIPLRAGAAAPDALPDTLAPAPGDALPPFGETPAASAGWAIGLIYDTILLNPAFGALGPRLSNDEQVELFSPDYVVERATLVSILLLGAASAGRDGRPLMAHGVPALAPDLGALVSPLNDDEIRAFHFYSDEPRGKPYLHMGYLPHAVGQMNPLLPMAILRVTERLEALFPEQQALLSIVKRNFAWRLKVQSAG
ncbi:MAG TPA: hypothetical protein VHI51_01300 [Ktedonobacterales bacterium]|jgi:hypothetical protein|nr:hypothetical protein [Ktedonobacterales bacterium]